MDGWTSTSCPAILQSSVIFLGGAAEAHMGGPLSCTERLVLVAIEVVHCSVHQLVRQRHVSRA